MLANNQPWWARQRHVSPWRKRTGAFAANFELGELLADDRHFRLQPSTVGPTWSANAAMDDWSAGNMAQLEAAANGFIAAQGALFQQVCALIAPA